MLLRFYVIAQLVACRCRWDDVCDVEVVLGCTEASAYNYNAVANTNDNSCVSVVNGCTDAAAYNYNALATTLEPLWTVMEIATVITKGTA